MDATLLYITTEHKQQAEALAAALLEERLIACANILPGSTALYRWEGEIRRAEECILIAKTTAAQTDAAIARIRALHSYDCPCILALPVAGGNAAFLRWLEAQTS